MILLTGATGGTGTELLPRLLEAGHQVRALVTEPSGLGRARMDVQVALGDLGNPLSLRHAARGVEAVVHLAGSTRDQPSGSIEELNGMATVRLLRAAEREGADKFIFLSSLGASEVSASRFLRSKAIAERTVLGSDMPSCVIASSVVCGSSSGWIRRLRAAPSLPVVPLPSWAKGQSRPLAASELAARLLGSIADEEAITDRVEIVGPREYSAVSLVGAALSAADGERPVVSVPGPMFAASMRAARLIPGATLPAPDELALLREDLGGASGTCELTVAQGDPFADFAP